MTVPRIGSARRRASAETPPLAADARPRLASGVVFEEAAHGEGWIATFHGVPSARMSGTIVELLTAMDGHTALRDLRARFAASESEESFGQLIRRLSAAGFLGDDARLPPGRLSYRPPFTLQVATLRAPALFGGMNRLLLPVPPRVLLWVVAVLLSGGILAAIAQAGELRNALTRPIALPGLVVVVVVLSLLTLLHECAHGLTLTRFGGSARRAGFMLFYLTPAFFVDVTDGWRLRDRRQRIAVALAGPAVHALAAAVALLAALLLPQPAVHEVLLLVAVSCVGVVLLNLIPFVRFDGYIALMSAVDEPNLRVRAMRDGADFLARILFGGRRSSMHLERWWSVPFGLASLVAPAVLVLFAIARAVRALAGGGPILGLLVVTLEAVVVLVAVSLLAKALLRIFRSGVSRLRVISVCALLLATIVTAGAFIPVPVTATLGFVARDDGVVLVQAAQNVDVDVPAGAHVVLTSSGILANDRVGDAVARPRRPTPTEAPLDALLPVTAAGVSVPAVVVARLEVAEEAGNLPPAGQARIELGVRNLWQTLWTTGVTMPLSLPGSGK
ncbi:daptide biosynthesis intramembrane metalloprotease [Microbacterium sp. NPDC028030]|uniref:daptide biosynthesis intramembrane metalloprotease n=1 Tax=Microbacterium sp. NPDC028030 TaxID=3155124 RepID=UPI0033CAF8DA